ncbi:MAG TPA: PQQ-binding-like beta-propeller repeat protein [Vicinamibacterales bacterium]|nr:PQQ-binding-like beta-propeller repeat protein [Vicinamibacterales bacterium]
MRSLLPGAALLWLVALSQSPGQTVPWPVNGGPDNIRYSPLDQINRTNVARLEVAWTYDSRDAFRASEMQSNPIIVDGVLYATTPTLKVVAIDAGSGREIWKFDPSGGATTSPRFRHRGVTVHRDRVFVSYRSFLYALARKTGEPISSFGTKGRIDLREGLDQPAERLSVSASTPGSIFEDMIIMGSSVPETLPGSPGHIRAFDVNTGINPVDLPHDPEAGRIRLRDVAEGRPSPVGRRQRVGRRDGRHDTRDGVRGHGIGLL